MFEFFAEYWVYLFVIFWFAINISIVWRFWKEIILKHKTLQSMTDKLRSDKSFHVKVCKITSIVIFIMIPTILFLIIIAPLVWLDTNRRDIEASKVKAKKSADEQEKYYQFCLNLEKERIAKIKEIEVENIKRQTLRQAWFAKHPPVLFYNTINGITAVLLPADYEDIKTRTKTMLIDGFWENEKVLFLAVNTFVFVTKKGREQIERKINACRLIAGNLSQLQEITENRNCKLEKKDDIFVPFANEIFIRFDEQRNTMKHRRGDGVVYYAELIDDQAPKEMREIKP